MIPLQLKLAATNQWPIEALLLRGNDVVHWLNEVARMQLDAEHLSILPLPGITPNSIHGCLLISPQLAKADIGCHERMQCLHTLLYIPQYTTIHPLIDQQELSELFQQQPHCWHPAIGLCTLPQPLQLSSIISLPPFAPATITAPERAYRPPQKVQTFEVISNSPEEVMQQMEDHLFPKSKPIPNDALNLFEKLRLAAYTLLGGAAAALGSKSIGSSVHSSRTKAGGSSKILDAIARFLGKGTGRLFDKMVEDMESLQRRNQSQLNKLINMFDKNIEDALQHALPLDGIGSTRGDNNGAYNLSKLWNSFSLFQNNASGSGGAVSMDGDTYMQLRQQYIKAADQLIEKKAFDKAAFIHLKLLKNPFEAASILAKGNMYQQAATIYLQHCNNKQAAAEAYASGRMYQQAIALYKQLQNHEKVGDLYVQLRQQDEANLYYRKVVEYRMQGHQYALAGNMLQYKMNNLAEAQEVYKKGWLVNKDSYNCMQLYLNNIEGSTQVHKELEYTFNNELTNLHKPVFIRVLKQQMARHADIKQPIKDMAYAIIADTVITQPNMADELKAFEPKDPELTKDIIKWKAKNRQRN